MMTHSFSNQLCRLPYRLVLLLTTVAPLLPGCSGDDPLVDTRGNEGPYNSQTGLTRFATSSVQYAAGITPNAPVTPGIPVTKTYLNSDGTFWWTPAKGLWTMGDNIFVNTVDNSSDPDNILIPTGTTINKKQATAEFFVEEELGAARYQVHYTGKPGIAAADPFSVTVNAAQHQDTPNDATHLEYDGDCGTAWANRNDTCYWFDLHHKAAYLLFLPYSAQKPQADRCKLIKIEVEDMDGKSIAGKYGFSFNGLADTPSANASNKVTLTLGDDKKGWDLDEKVDTLLVENGRLPSHLQQTDGAYMVIHPGSKNLKITYYVQYFTLQSNWYDNNAYAWRFDYEDGGKGGRSWTIYDADCNPTTKTYHEDPWVLPDAGSSYIGTLEGFDGETGFYTFTRELHLDEPLQANDYRRISHRLHLIEADSVYDFCQQYYQWDAQDWFWGNWNWHTTFSTTGAPANNTDYPRKNNEVIMTSYLNVANSNCYQNYGNAANKFNITTEDMKTMPEGARSTKDMPSANEMSWYLQYGKPHYDGTTTWYMKGFHDGYTLCRGGVWMLEKSKWKDTNGRTVTPDCSVCAPMYSKTLLEDSEPVHLELPFDLGAVSMGGSRNLRRYYDRTYSIRVYTGGAYKTYSDLALNEEWGYDAKKKPLAYEIADYFFIPFFGYIESLEPSAEGLAQKPWEEDHLWNKLKLVGVRTHLWSRTPQRFSGHINNDTGQEVPYTPNNAYYLYANEEYVSISWYNNSPTLTNLNRWGHIAGHRQDGTKWFK